jgi:hypothetical protein
MMNLKVRRRLRADRRLRSASRKSKLDPKPDRAFDLDQQPLRSRICDRSLYQLTL